MIRVFRGKGAHVGGGPRPRHDTWEAFIDLRHTCATILPSSGVHAKLVQEFLGHATISITLDTYSHVLPGMDEGLSEAMGDALG
jgi:integrase